MSEAHLLESLKCPEDIDKLNEVDLKALCKELLERNSAMSLTLSVIHTGSRLGRCMCRHLALE